MSIEVKNSTSIKVKFTPAYSSTLLVQSSIKKETNSKHFMVDLCGKSRVKSKVPPNSKLLPDGPRNKKAMEEERNSNNTSVGNPRRRNLNERMIELFGQSPPSTKSSSNNIMVFSFDSRNRNSKEGENKSYNAVKSSWKRENLKRRILELFGESPPSTKPSSSSASYKCNSNRDKLEKNDRSTLQLRRESTKIVLKLYGESPIKAKISDHGSGSNQSDSNTKCSEYFGENIKSESAERKLEKLEITNDPSSKKPKLEEEKCTHKSYEEKDQPVMDLQRQNSVTSRMETKPSSREVIVDTETSIQNATVKTRKLKEFDLFATVL